MSSSGSSSFTNRDSSDLNASPSTRAKRQREDKGEISSENLKRTKRYSAASLPSPPPQPLIVHRVSCDHPEHKATGEWAYFEDTPRLFVGDSKATRLHGKHRITQALFGDQYADGNPHISFIVIKSYDCRAYHDSIKDEFEAISIPESVAKALSKFNSYFFLLGADGGAAEAQSERISIISKDLQKAMEVIRTAHPEHFPLEEMTRSLIAPYLCVYHARSVMKDYMGSSTDGIIDNKQLQVRSLVDYIQDSHQAEFEEADDEFERGMVSEHHFSKLFGPNDIVVRGTSTGPIAYVIDQAIFSEDKFQLDCWTFEFDGIFYKLRSTWTVEWPSSSTKIPIASLTLYPLKYDSGVSVRLRKRGNRFWDFRKTTLVEYESETSVFELRATSNRYMIDLKTYGQMHPEAAQTHADEEEGLENQDSPPADPFLLLLPRTIRGYGFHDKKWSILSVELTQAVSWSSGTFDRQLVLKAQKKELIKALITVHTASKQKKSDIIEGKGKGLILLLHGGPGTGKTLTAESIAEFAKRPLYRVTCGDIGTDAESVEKYLESVLYIGTLWGCVVLLDEADVFLEERTPQDLQRNALVSVFLRALEYFEGILILTSNRVGTFDEAFKYRVQLAMHYPPLNESGRWEVWNMFFRDMLDKDESIKYQHGLKDKLGVLARQKLNGRQIRNTINTARQLAQYRKEDLSYMHVEQALDVVNEFEQYISDMRGSDEDYAKNEGHRI